MEDIRIVCYFFASVSANEWAHNVNASRRRVHSYCKVALLCVNMQNNLTFRFMNRSENSFIHFVVYALVLQFTCRRHTKPNTQPQPQHRSHSDYTDRVETTTESLHCDTIILPTTFAASRPVSLCNDWATTTIKKIIIIMKEQMRWREIKRHVSLQCHRLFLLPLSLSHTHTQAPTRTAFRPYTRCNRRHIYHFAVGTPNMRIALLSCSVSFDIVSLLCRAFHTQELFTVWTKWTKWMNEQMAGMFGAAQHFHLQPTCSTETFFLIKDRINLIKWIEWMI